MVNKKNEIHVVDMFCGGGGESTGLFSAAEKIGFKIKLSAINHWERAIETHAANYPSAEHFCESVEHLDPTKVVSSGKLDLLWASPECTHHSKARGGRPKSEQSRATAWNVLKWASELYIERIIIENVPDFLTWGPLNEKGQIIKSKSGSTFRAFIHGLRSLGYNVDWKILCAADYGASTTRKRLFIQAVRGRKKILWPEQTNTEDKNNLFGLPGWEPAEKIIDWSLPCPSIFSRAKPLAEATLKRIESGLKKFSGKQAEPFVAILRGQSKTRSIHSPLPTITCSGAHYALIEPFITAIGQTSAKDRSRSLSEPLSTIVTKQEHCLVKPFITKYFGTGENILGLDSPLSTITTKDRFGLAIPDGTVCDIGFRMLQPHELAAATGFPPGYRFTGTKAEVVKQIGNAVPPVFAEKLFTSYVGKENAKRSF